LSIDRGYRQVLEEEGRKYGWGLLLVSRPAFTEFLRVTRPETHLDVGCHRMLLKRVVEEVAGAEYIGLDVWHYGAKIDVMASGDLPPLRPASVDTASMIEVLEHLPDYPRALSSLAAACRKGLFVQSVVCTSRAALLDRTHYHVLHPATLERLCRLLGFRDVKWGMAGENFWLYALK